MSYRLLCDCKYDLELWSKQVIDREKEAILLLTRIMD